MLVYPSPTENAASIAGVALFMAGIILLFVAQRHETLIVGSLICAAYAIYSHRSVKVTKNHMALFLIFTVLFIPGLLKFDHGLVAIFYFMSTLSVFVAAKAIAQYSPVVIWMAFRLIYTLALSAIGFILYTYWGYPEPLGEVIEGSSTNGIPAYLIVIQVGVSLSHYLVKGKLPIISTLATSVVAYFGIGRGSIVVALLITISSLIFNIILGRSVSAIRRYAVVVLSLTVFVAMAWNSEFIAEQLNSDTKMKEGLRDAQREEILRQYVDQMTPVTLFLGAGYEGTVIDFEYLGNPHVSYIRTHSYFGLPITLLALFSPIFVLFSKKTWDARLVFFTFIFFAAFRALSEPIFFPTLLDFFYFLYFFVYYKYASRPYAVISAKRGMNY